MIRLEGIRKQYDLGEVKVDALQSVSLEIRRGEYVAIMGPSGSGKSTLMHILGILDAPSAGRYFLEDYDITNLADRELARIRNKHFGFIFQSFNLFPELSALENVMLPMGYAGVPMRQRRERAAILLEDVGLGHRFHHLPTMMSGGEQQRVAIARALSNNPDLILADEPTGALDSTTSHEVMQVLRSINEGGTTVVVVTHEHDIAHMTQRIIRLDDGVIGGDHRLPATAAEPPAVMLEEAMA